eukprot:Rhum_TRINITY_DN22906_c0_g1::Rhum_TRINITY_DN22906_c0_g1_i1::g.176518::m.176518
MLQLEGVEVVSVLVEEAHRVLLQDVVVHHAGHTVPSGQRRVAVVQDEVRLVVLREHLVVQEQAALRRVHVVQVARRTLRRVGAVSGAARKLAQVRRTLGERCLLHLTHDAVPDRLLHVVQGQLHRLLEDLRAYGAPVVADGVVRRVLRTRVPVVRRDETEHADLHRLAGVGAGGAEHVHDHTHLTRLDLLLELLKRLLRREPRVELRHAPLRDAQLALLVEKVELRVRRDVRLRGRLRVRLRRRRLRHGVVHLTGHTALNLGLHRVHVVHVDPPHHQAALDVLHNLLLLLRREVLAVEQARPVADAVLPVLEVPHSARRRLHTDLAETHDRRLPAVQQVEQHLFEARLHGQGPANHLAARLAKARSAVVAVPALVALPVVHDRRPLREALLRRDNRARVRHVLDALHGLAFGRRRAGRVDLAGDGVDDVGLGGGGQVVRDGGRVARELACNVEELRVCAERHGLVAAVVGGGLAAVAAVLVLAPLVARQADEHVVPVRHPLLHPGQEVRLPGPGGHLLRAAAQHAVRGVLQVQRHALESERVQTGHLPLLLQRHGKLVPRQVLRLGEHPLAQGLPDGQQRLPDRLAPVVQREEVERRVPGGPHVVDVQRGRLAVGVRQAQLQNPLLHEDGLVAPAEDELQHVEDFLHLPLAVEGLLADVRRHRLQQLPLVREQSLHDVLVRPVDRLQLQLVPLRQVRRLDFLVNVPEVEALEIRRRDDLLEGAGLRRCLRLPRDLLERSLLLRVQRDVFSEEQACVLDVVVAVQLHLRVHLVPVASALFVRRKRLLVVEGVLQLVEAPPRRGAVGLRRGEPPLAAGAGLHVEVVPRHALMLHIVRKGHSPFVGLSADSLPSFNEVQIL